MADLKSPIRWVQILSCIAVIALFAADYGFDVMAKAPPVWAYAIPGLLALGLEMGALRRLVVAAIRVAARIPEDRQ